MCEKKPESEPSWQSGQARHVEDGQSVIDAAEPGSLAFGRFPFPPSFDEATEEIK